MFSVFGVYTYIEKNRRKTIFLFTLLFVLAYLFLFTIYLLFHRSNVPTDVIALKHALKSNYNYGRAMDLYFLAILKEAWWEFLKKFPITLFIIIMWLALGIAFYKVLLTRPMGAVPIERKDNPRIYNLVETLCISAGMSIPQIFIIESISLNAYALSVSTDYSAISVTTGLMEALDDAELDAVLAHELTHIRNKDSQVMVTAVVITGLITYLSELILRFWLGFSGNAPSQGSTASDAQYSDDWHGDFSHLMFLLGQNKFVSFLRFFLVSFLMGMVWFGALLVRFSLSKTREYLADAGAVELTKNPDALISALLKLEGKSDVYAIPSSAMQLCFDNPRRDFMGVFATHPTIAQRIERLISHTGGQIPKPRKKTHRFFESSRFG